VSVKRLTRVAQRMAMHAVSGFSCMHPCLGECCSRHDLSYVEVDLIYARFQPVISDPATELNLAAAALREKFQEVLIKEGLKPSAIISALATFDFESDHWPMSCHVAIATVQYGVLGYAVDSTGAPIQISKLA